MAQLAEGQAILKTDRNWKARILVSQSARIIWRIVHYVVVFGICFIIIQPLLAKIGNGFMAYEDILDPSVIYVPKNFDTIFLRLTFQGLNYWSALRDTVFLCLLVGTLQVFAASMVGYGFARFKFPGRSALFSLLLLAMIIPQIVILVPQYILFNSFDFFGLIRLVKPNGISLLGTLWPYILTSLTVMGFKQGLYVYLLRQFYRGIPRELEESAYIDGCNKLGTYFKIILPGATSILLACFLFAIVWTWTDSFYLAYFMPPLQPFGRRLVTIATEVSYLILYEEGYIATPGSDYIFEMPSVGLMVSSANAAVIWTIAPLVLIYIFLQRFFVESIERSGLK